MHWELRGSVNGRRRVTRVCKAGFQHAQQVSPCKRPGSVQRVHPDAKPVMSSTRYSLRQVCATADPTRVAARRQRRQGARNQGIAIDLGTARTLISVPRVGIVVDEPTVIARSSGGEVIAAGRDAWVTSVYDGTSLQHAGARWHRAGPGRLRAPVATAIARGATGRRRYQRGHGQRRRHGARPGRVSAGCCDRIRDRRAGHVGPIRTRGQHRCRQRNHADRPASGV